MLAYFSIDYLSINYQLLVVSCMKKIGWYDIELHKLAMLATYFVVEK